MLIQEVQAKLDAAETQFQIALRAFKLAQSAMKRSRSQKNVAAYVEASEAFDIVSAECRDLGDQLQKAYRKAEREAWHSKRIKPAEQMALF